VDEFDLIPAEIHNELLMASGRPSSQDSFSYPVKSHITRDIFVNGNRS